MIISRFFDNNQAAWCSSVHTWPSCRGPLVLLLLLLILLLILLLLLLLLRCRVLVPVVSIRRPCKVATPKSIVRIDGGCGWLLRLRLR